MLDIIRKSLFVGLGVAVSTRERVEEIAKKFARESELSESEGKKFVDEMRSKADEFRSALEKMINDRVNFVLGKMDVPTREEFEALKKRISILEAEQSGEG
jgi:polyhydroxyalkanoate synthesis regulator phasin